MKKLQFSNSISFRGLFSVTCYVFTFTFLYRWKNNFEVVIDGNLPLCQLCERLHLVNDQQIQVKSDEFNTVQLILPPKKVSKIKLPKPHLDGIVEENGWQKRYLNLKDWYVTGICVVPKAKSRLYNFIHGI